MRNWLVRGDGLVTGKAVTCVFVDGTGRAVLLTPPASLGLPLGGVLREHLIAEGKVARA